MTCFAWLTAIACKSECSGVVVDGACQELCVDSECGSGKRCVDNQCSLKCDGNEDCRGGAKCREVRTDSGKRGNYCVGGKDEPPKQDAGGSDDDQQDDGSTDDDMISMADAGDGQIAPPPVIACESNADCYDPNTQTNCIEGRCVVTCLLHEHCGEVGACTGSALDSDGVQVAFCERDDFPRGPGQYEWKCINGNDNCDADAGFRCLSRGEGDLSGYCAQLGCQGDEGCPKGYYCRHDRFANRPPCEAACGQAGDPSAPNCVPLELIGDDQPFSCVGTEIELRSCQRRTFCNSCETDADCRALPNHICADQGDGNKICTTLCDPVTGGCPWGSAAECAVHDQQLGVPTCAHRFGACRADGASCDPCVDDRDCPDGFCSGSTYSGEQFCVNLDDVCSCPAGAAFCAGGGCPLTPAGQEMNCVPGSSGEAPSVCFGSTSDPNDVSSQLACWPE